MSSCREEIGAMKIIHCLLMLGMVAICDAEDTLLSDIRPEEIRGRVVSATWQGPHKFELRIPQEDDVWSTTFTVAGSWFLLLEGVKGVGLKECEMISRRFASSYPSDPLACDYKPAEGRLYIRIWGEKDLPVTTGSTVVLKKCRFDVDLLGVTMSFDNVMVMPKNARPIQTQEKGRGQKKLTSPR